MFRTGEKADFERMLDGREMVAPLFSGARRLMKLDR